MNKYIKLSCAAVISISANTLVAQEVAVPFEETRISYQDVFLGLRNNDLAAQETASSAGDLRTSRQDVFLIHRVLGHPNVEGLTSDRRAIQLRA
jgi:hypothetical protein